MKDITLQEHPDFETFARMIEDMSVKMIKTGAVFTDQQIAGDLMRIILENHEDLPFDDVAVIAAMIAALGNRAMPADMRATIEGTPSARTH